MRTVESLCSRLVGEQVEFRKLLMKNVTFTVTEKMMKEFEAAKCI